MSAIQSTKTMQTFLLVALLLFGSFGFSQKAKASSGEEISIEMGEMFFKVNGEEVKQLNLVAGKEYELEFKNVGEIKHEVLFGRESFKDGNEYNYKEYLMAGVTIDIEGTMKVGNKEMEFEIESNGLLELELEPGVALKVHVTFPESLKGEWEMGCFIPGHYQMNMKLPLIIE